MKRGILFFNRKSMCRGHRQGLQSNRCKIAKHLFLLCLLCLLLCGCGAAKEAGDDAPDVEETVSQAEDDVNEQEAEKEAAKEAEKAVAKESEAEKEAAEKGETEKTAAGKWETGKTAADEQAAEKPAAGKAEAGVETDAAAEKQAGQPTKDNAETVVVNMSAAAEEPEETLTEVTEQVNVFEEPKIMYATNAVNVRRGPSTDYEIIGHLARAQQIEATGQAETKWYQVTIDGKPAYVSNKYLSETAPVPQTVPENQTADSGASSETQTKPAQTIAPAGVIMVGDSRCVQMQAAVGGGGCTWICENSKEYTWFVEKAIPQIDGCVGKGSKVVINLGVNDPEHYKQYAETINSKAAEWAQKGAATYLVSVNPVWENPYTTQEQVDMFNANVPGMLSGVTWIDTSTWLVTNGYRVLDGLHYDDPTYVNIFNLIMGSI